MFSFSRVLITLKRNQYADSVIGHCDDDPGSLYSRVRKQLGDAQADAETVHDKWLGVYRRDCLRLQSICHTLRMRLPQSPRNQSFSLMDGGYRSMVRLFYHYLRGMISGKHRDAAELGLIRGFMAGKRAGRARS